MYTPITTDDADAYRTALDALQPGIGPKGKLLLTVYLCKAACYIQLLNNPEGNRAILLGGLPIEMTPERYDLLLERIVAERGTLDGFDIAVRAEPGERAPDYTADTATWAVHSWPAVADLGHLFNPGVHGPPG